MSIPRDPLPSKLVVSLIMREKALLREVLDLLTEPFGPVDMVGPWLPFDDTDYYHVEMGLPLFRRLVAFSKLIQQESLAPIKLLTNTFEKRFADAGKRAVNIDPGYLVAERFVLATGKNFTHRIYLQERIYADLTLIYQKGRFRQLDWTYPDYAGAAIIGFLHSVRARYLYQLKKSPLHVDKSTNKKSGIEA
jgi:hypothetical protein